MATTYKVLGQVAPASTALSVLYSSTGQSVVSTIVVCNLSTAMRTFRLTASTSTSPGSANYLWRDQAVPVGDSFVASVTITMGALDVIKVAPSSTGTVLAFSAFGATV